MKNKALGRPCSSQKIDSKIMIDFGDYFALKLDLPDYRDSSLLHQVPTLYSVLHGIETKKITMKFSFRNTPSNIGVLK